jgi:DNA mismatch endonuclease (patch repair protein)
MADVHDKKTRSYNMSRIKSKNTKPEMLVRRFLFGNGFRYRLHVKDLPRRPDIVLPKYKCIIFVHGCFWHKHSNCKFAKIPESNNDYWRHKLEGNVQRDKEQKNILRRAGWKVIVLWSCKLTSKNVNKTLHQLIKKLAGNISF